MSVAATDIAQPLRVCVDANDPHRRATLERIVLAAGHVLAASDIADVILSDGDRAPVGRAPVVAIGTSDVGYAGHLARDATATQIDAALRAAAVGLTVRAATQDVAFGELPEPLLPLLTPRETEVLTAIAEGLSNKEIARRLDISLHTVKFHIESLLRKLDARSRAEAVAKTLARRAEV